MGSGIFIGMFFLTVKTKAVSLSIIPFFVLMVFFSTVNAGSWDFSLNREEIISQDPPVRWGLSAINACGAWKITKGSEKIVVAVIDSGIDFAVDLLNNQIWINNGEIPGDSKDNDGNGYIDDLHGWDFWDDDSSSTVGTGINYHGTFVAGIVASSLDRSTGTGGVAPNVKLMDLRVLDGRGHLYINNWGNLVEAIEYAVENGAKIINLSIYPTLTPPEFVHTAIKEAVQRGVLVVGIAGNGGDNVQHFGRWKEVLTVGAIDKGGNPWGYSNHGLTVDVVAPGVDILSVVPGGRAERHSGTSFAAAHVAGAAALVLSIRSNIPVCELKEILQQSATDLMGAGYDPQTGYGLVNVEKALKIAQSD